VEIKRWKLCLIALGLIAIGCNRDKSETIDTSMLSAPTSPQAEDAPQAGNAPASADMPQPAISQPATSSPITYSLPPGWSQQPGTDMRFATLTGPEHVQIAITVFPGDVGGTLANINRWRKQMDLPAITQDQLTKSVTSVPTPVGLALLADLSNHGQRMLAAMLPTENQTWFLKMNGASSTIGRHTGEFMATLKSVNRTAER
jgi:hypothetical protein